MNIRKFFQTEVKSIDEQAKTVEVVFSTEDVDRDGDVVVQAGWDFEEYAKNPVVLWGHDSYSYPVGKTLNVRTEGQKSIATIMFAKADEAAERLFNLVKQGILRTVSAGFINEEAEGNRLLKNRLLEISWVAIPANQNAITLAYESGMIEKGDLEFLQKHYTKQLNYINKEVKDYTMDKDQLQEALNEAIKPLSEKLEALQEQVTSTNDKLAEADTKPPIEDGSTNANEVTISEEEVNTAIAEGVAQALAE